MNQSVSTYNSTLIGEGGGEGREYMDNNINIIIGLLSNIVCVPISFETDCRLEYRPDSQNYELLSNQAEI